MESSIKLRPSERKRLLDYYRKSTDPAVRLRAHILLLLHDGHPWSRIVEVTYTSTRTIRRLLATLPDDETAVFQDEVDLHLNPKRGAMWMRRGQQAEVPTPGTNHKRHLPGSLHWRTGQLLLSEPGTRRNADLFVRHLDDLRRRLRRYRVVHVICDNGPFHDCRRVCEYLAQWGHRIQLHFLPTYAPKTMVNRRGTLPHSGQGRTRLGTTRDASVPRNRLDYPRVIASPRLPWHLHFSGRRGTG